jgi:hypothetical protein
VRPWAFLSHNFPCNLGSFRHNLNAIFTEPQSSRARPCGFARSHRIKRTRLHQACKVSHRNCVCCERSHNLKIVLQAYAGHTHKNLKDACFHSLRATRALEYTCFCVLTVHSGHKIVRVGGHTFLKSTCNSCLFGHCCSCCCLRLLLLPLLRLLPPLRIPMRLPRALQMLTLKWHQVVCYQTTI